MYPRITGTNDLFESVMAENNCFCGSDGLSGSGSNTAWSKKNQAKFSDTCSVRADGLCIGCPSLVGRRKAANSNMLEFFCTTLYMTPSCCCLVDIIANVCMRHSGAGVVWLLWLAVCYEVRTNLIRNDNLIP